MRWSELDASGTVSPANYLRYLLETAWDWGIAIGWDADYSQNPDVLWLIRETEIRFLQPLRHYDEFDLTIWMVHWQKVRGTRCFELTRKGEWRCDRTGHPAGCLRGCEDWTTGQSA